MSASVRFPLGPPATNIFGWLAVTAVFVPVPFVWARPIWFQAAMVIAVAASIALAIVHRIRTRPRGWVVAHGWGLSRSSKKRPEQTVARYAESFGVTLLASQAKRRAILALTTPTQTRFIGVRLEGPSAGALLTHASIVADGDALTAHASDDGSMSADAALALLRLIRERAPNAQRRLYLSGTRGERIVLDGSELRVETRTKKMAIDLLLPVEWRGFLFHETLGAAASIYQATWIRQGASEIVLVAPMPTELLVSASRNSPATPMTGARRVREAQLIQSNPDEPPPGDLRTGIERVFMLPVREALARAPLPARSAPPKRVSSPDLGA